MSAQANGVEAPAALVEPVRALPPGRYGAAVSGGADSVALLMLLHRHRPDLYVHVIHLDHETRAGESAVDARFVAELAARLALPCTAARRSEIEPSLAKPPANRSALYRAVRLELFRRTALRQRLSAVLLAHHADDQAETVFQRLLRGSGPVGLAGMSVRSVIGGVPMIRPLLGVARGALRDYLRSIGQDWREDSSNESDAYLRNRIRRILAACPRLRQAVLELGCAAGALREWLRAAAPQLPDVVPLRVLQELPRLLADQAARRWLADRGCPPDELSPSVVGRLLLMACDLASPPRCVFPGGVVVARRGGRLRAMVLPNAADRPSDRAEASSPDTDDDIEPG